MRVLVVENDFLQGLALARELELLGWEVVGPVATVEEALGQVEAQRFDGALLDYRLRQGSSVELARRLRALGCPFAFLSGYSRLPDLPEDLERSRRLSKPTSREALALALREFVSGDGAG